MNQKPKTGTAKEIAAALIEGTRTQEVVPGIPAELVRISNQPKNPQPIKGAKK